MADWDEALEDEPLAAAGGSAASSSATSFHGTGGVAVNGQSCDPGTGEAPGSGQPEAFRLVCRGAIQEALRLLEASPHLWHQRDEEGHTLLHWGALCGHVPFVSHAVAAGVPVDAVANNLQTPLMWAVIRGQVAAARLLLEAKADPHARDSLGACPAVLAVQHQQHSVLLLLLSLDGRERMLRIADNNGCSVVHWAAYKVDLTSLKLLDYFDAELNAVDGQKMTPLHRAVQGAEGSPNVKALGDLCEFLLEKGADPSQADAQGRTCRDLVALRPDVGAQQLLGDLLDRASGKGGSSVVDVEMGRGGSKAGEAKRPKINPSHYVAPLFWLVSVSIASFQYLTELRVIAWRLTPLAAALFELCVPVSVGLFFWVSNSDPGKVPPRLKTASGVEDLMAALKTCGQDSAPDFSRLCTTTWVLKGLRTKYCVRTGACVEEFDHFCGWLNCAIGKGNHRMFIVLTFVECFTQLVNLYVCWAVAYEQVRASSKFTWIPAVAMEYPVLLLIMLLHVFTAPGILFLGANQLRLVAMNLTTNEMMNAFRYGHFWVDSKDPGRAARVFRNPFDKGGPLPNCVDFWWARRRAERGPKADDPDALACTVGARHACTGCHAK